jgi:hypothetical protein
MKISILAGGAFFASVCAVPAQAGVLADDLSRCMITKMTDADRGAFMGWMFSAIAADPQLEKLTTLDRAKRDQLSKDAAGVFERLLLVDCRSQAIAAIKAEGASSITQSFGELGQAAAQQMFRSPQAMAELESLEKGFDKEKLKALGRDAGVPESELKD